MAPPHPLETAEGATLDRVNNNAQILLFSSRSDMKTSVRLIYDPLHFTSRIKLDQGLGWESF